MNKTTIKPLVNPIEKEELEAMINAQATRQEIISYYEGNKQALEDFSLKEYKLDFKTLYNRLIAKSKIDLRKKLLEIATNSEARASKHQLGALIYLSKNYLGATGENILSRGNMSNPGTKENKEGDSSEPALSFDDF